MDPSLDLVAIDQRNHGDSHALNAHMFKENEPFQWWPTMGEDILDVIQHLRRNGTQQVIGVGHSGACPCRRFRSRFVDTAPNVATHGRRVVAPFPGGGAGLYVVKMIGGRDVRACGWAW